MVNTNLSKEYFLRWSVPRKCIQSGFFSCYFLFLGHDMHVISKGISFHLCYFLVFSLLLFLFLLILGVCIYYPYAIFFSFHFFAWLLRWFCFLKNLHVYVFVIVTIFARVCARASLCVFVYMLVCLTMSMHYNKRCPCMPNDFIRLWVNSFVLVNGN
jgi:hypothetical protein